MIVFKCSDYRNQALEEAPWLSTVRWDPSFSVIGHCTVLPVWIEPPFRSAVFEFFRWTLAKRLGPNLVYLNGDDFSSYPND